MSIHGPDHAFVCVCVCVCVCFYGCFSVRWVGGNPLLGCAVLYCAVSAVLYLLSCLWTGPLVQRLASQ